MIEIAVIRLCPVTEKINTLLRKRRLALNLFRSKRRVSLYFFLVNNWLPKESLSLLGQSVSAYSTAKDLGLHPGIFRLESTWYFQERLGEKLQIDVGPFLLIQRTMTYPGSRVQADLQACR